MAKKVDRMVESVARYASASSGESLPSSSSSSNEREKPSHILGPDTPSSFTESSLREFVKENKLAEICYFIPTPHLK